MAPEMLLQAFDRPLLFEMETVTSRFIGPDGQPVQQQIEVRTHPVSGRRCRITFARKAEEPAADASLPPRPPGAHDRDSCPFCRPALNRQTPQIPDDWFPGGRLIKGTSVLFPNLFPYGRYSAVSLFDDRHFVEIGTADPGAYVDCFLNCRQYLAAVSDRDPAAKYVAITQNHLPSAGGSLLHPHLQVHADRIAGNHHRYLEMRATSYYKATGRYLFADYLAHEKAAGQRYIGATGAWKWLAAYAPEGFYEIWGILPGIVSFQDLAAADWQGLVSGIFNTQRFYRSLGRNGYNLGLIAIADPRTRLDLRVVMLVRSNYAPWVRNDHTGYEIMLGDMATFTAPEETATAARPFWQDPGAGDTRDA